MENALVVDVGGTTTDLALVEGGRTRLNDGAATVGNYHTSVRTIQARSFGLGGDSLVRFDPQGGISVGPERVVPLSYLASQHPQIKEGLLAWLEGGHALRHADRVEYWILRREPKQPFTDARTNRVIELLREGPCRMPDLLKKVGAVSPALVDAEQLFRRELIDRACLTPTDLMHVGGEFAPWDAEIARAVVEAAARTREQTSADFVRDVREWITRRITAEIVQFLSGCSVPEESSHLRKPDLGAWLFRHNLQPEGNFLRSELRLEVPLVGIGAPAGYFLPEVADALHTRLILPEHYEVANAVGTVVADVMVRHEAEVAPFLNGAQIAGYAVRGVGRRREFETREEAVTFAREALGLRMLDEARAAGAHAPVLDLQEEEQAAGILRLNACAFGSPDGEMGA